MDFFQAIVLAIGQGLSEFLPISSSGHLILIPHFVGWTDQGLAFDVAVHLGTLLAVLLYFRRQLGIMAVAWIDSVFRRQHTRDSRLAWQILVATIPVGLAGLLFDDFIEANFRNPLFVAGAFVASLPRSGQPRRIVYVGTTGIYGGCHGEWVDAPRPANPSVDRARRRWDAECRLREWAADSGGELIVRVAGIYGPGRLPLDRLRRGQPMVAEDEAPWTNRIHADDLATVCVAAMDHAPGGAVYNVSDDHPGNMADYFNRVADLAGLPRPPVVRLADAGGTLSEGLLSYLRESRRLDNRRMLRELGVTLRYPTLEAGLPGCLGGRE